MKTLEEIFNKKVYKIDRNFKDSLWKFVSDKKPWTLNEIENSDWLK